MGSPNIIQYKDRMTGLTGKNPVFPVILLNKKTADIITSRLSPGTKVYRTSVSPMISV